jgi:uncharacterized protein (TIRG00374 family)
MILGLIVFVLYLYFFVGFDQIFLVVSSVNVTQYLIFYFASIASMVLVIFNWVAAWRALLKTLKVPLSFKKGVLYYWIGFFIDLIVPCQQICGEVTRMYLVQKETNKDYGVIGAAGVTNRVVSYSIVFTGLTVGVAYLFVKSAVPPFALYLLVLSWVGALAYFAILLYLALSAQAAEKLAVVALRVLKALRIKKYRSGEFSPGLVDSLKKFHQGFGFFRAHPKSLIKPVIFQAVAYALNLSTYVLIFYALGLDYLNLDFFILVYFLAGAVQDAASVFSVGGLEILLTNLFIFYGVAPATSGVAAAVLRSVTFWFPLIVGYIIVQVVGARQLLKAEVREKIEAEQKKETEVHLEAAGTTRPLD